MDLTNYKLGNIPPEEEETVGDGVMCAVGSAGRRDGASGSEKFPPINFVRRVHSEPCRVIEGKLQRTKNAEFFRPDAHAVPAPIHPSMTS